MTSAAPHEIFSVSFRAPAVDAAECVDIDRSRLARRVSGFHRRGETALMPLAWSPFDCRWVSLDWGGQRREYLQHLLSRTRWIATTPRQEPLFTTLAVVDAGTLLIPLHTLVHGTPAPNLALEGRQYLLRLAASEDDLFHHVVAVLAAAGDQPALIPLPEEREQLLLSARIGRRVMELCSPHGAVERSDEPLRAIGVLARTGREARMLRGSALRVDDEPQVFVRDYTDDERSALLNWAIENGMRAADVFAIAGAITCDVHLNEKTVWRNVPLNVWEFVLRGRHVLREWLRGRSAPALGRPLSRDEATQFGAAARHIAALLLLGPELARNLEQVSAAAARRPRASRLAGDAGITTTAAR